MKNCQSDTARLGWSVHRSSASAPSLEVINHELQATGHELISDRMYRHYRRLAFHGYTEYLPINEFDIAIKMKRLAART